MSFLSHVRMILFFSGCSDAVFLRDCFPPKNHYGSLSLRVRRFKKIGDPKPRPFLRDSNFFPFFSFPRHFPVNSPAFRE